jgi:hypothetical protein
MQPDPEKDDTCIYLTPLSSTNKTGPHHIIEILLKVVLNTIKLTLTLSY